MTGPFSEAPKPLSTSGAWEARLKSMIHTITLAYRQGRPTNFLEGYVPLSRPEVGIMKRYHSQCSVNLEEGSGDAYLANQWMVDATHGERAGAKAYALRFVNTRAKVVLPYVVLVLIHTLGVGTLATLAFSRLARRTGHVPLAYR